MPWASFLSDIHAGNAIIAAAAFSIYGNFGLLQLAWAVVFLLSIPIIISPLIQRTCGGHENESNIRALQTGRLGVLLSANLFFVTTSILWAALLKLAKPLFDANIRIETPVGLLYPQIADVSGSHTLIEFSDSLYKLTVGNEANAYLLVLLAAILMVVVGIFPSAMSERKLPKSTIIITRGMACWLNGAFSSFKLAEWMLISAWLILALGYSSFSCDVSMGSSWVTVLGLLLAGSIPTLILGRKMLPGGFSQVLDIVLDISNWLKERPFSLNPRGRILVRYLSLLKFLSESGYQKVVVVAHSQGTVITADCLRLLEQSHAIRQSVFGESQPRIELVTLGSPLRQLYRERFPHQYDWVVKHNGPDIPIHAGAHQWVNCFRSGDYVGRTLWCEPEPDKMYPEVKPHTSTPYPCGDICVGAGAHLHYFDGSQSVVGKVVLELIL